MRELARRSRLTHTTVSEVLAGNREPTWEFCAAVAEPLNQNPITLFRMAGLMKEAPNDDITFHEIYEIIRRLTPKQREHVLKYAIFVMKEGDD